MGWDGVDRWRIRSNLGTHTGTLQSERRAEAYGLRAIYGVEDLESKMVYLFSFLFLFLGYYFFWFLLGSSLERSLLSSENAIMDLLNVLSFGFMAGHCIRQAF